MNNRQDWTRSRDNLISALQALGYPQELGDAIVKNLGSPKAMDRMTSYLIHVKPHSIELVVDEMLAIKSEIDAWKQLKEAQAANAAYNELLYYGLDNEEE